jgi:hypothetical protein
MRILWAAACLLVWTGCGNPSPPVQPMLGALGTACDNSSQCDSRYTCFMGECRDPSCMTPVTVCKTATDCCAPDDCFSGTCQPPGHCARSGQACQSIDDCCDGYSCSRALKQCVPAQNLALAEPCKDKSQCASGQCSLTGACTKACIDLQSCGTVGGTLCAQSTGQCEPSCAATNCAIYGAGIHCTTDRDSKNLSTIQICGVL